MWSENFQGTRRFQIIRRLGAGGMGIVYEAFDRETHAKVALKTLKSLRPDLLIRLKREFRSLQDIHHPNLIGLGELVEDEGQWFFTMEMVSGVDFITHVRGESAKPLAIGSDMANATTLHGTGQAEAEEDRTAGITVFDEARLRDALAQLAQGLQAIHDAGKVHRDIKPTNVIVTEGERVVLLDFGLVTDVHAPKETSHQLVGTAAYMAPEQDGRRAVGPEADWYSVGVVLYQALTGKLPFTGPLLKVLLDKQRVEPTAPSTLGPVPEDLDQLCRELLRIDPSARPSGIKVLRSLGRKTELRRGASKCTLAPVFVGREHELELLHAAFQETWTGKQVTVHVQGESGLGKSTLVRRFADQATEQAAALVLFGRCFERESVPYKAVDGVVDALTRYLSRIGVEEAVYFMPRRGGLLPRIFPVLRRVPAIMAMPTPEIADPQELRTRIFDAFRELFLRLTERHRVVLVIDDFQWADEDSLTMLSELIRPPEAPGLLLVTTWRELRAPGEPFAERVRRLPGDHRHVVLSPLSPQDARDLAAVLLERAGHCGDATERALSIAEDAGGHPLFIDELARQALSTGGNALRLEDVIALRMAGLEEAARKVLALVTIAGEPLELGVISIAGSILPHVLDRVVAELRVMNLVRTQGSGLGRKVETFHDRVRNTVAEGLSEEQVRACHGDIARALAAHGRADSESLAMHYKAAGVLDLAASHAVSAAHQASEALAFDRAARLYRLALDLRPADAPDVHNLRACLADALARAGYGVEAAEAYLLAARGRAAAEELDLRRRAAQQLLLTGHIDDGLTVLRDVLAAQNIRYPETRGQAIWSVLLGRLRLSLRGGRFRERDESLVPPKDLVRIDVCFHVGMSLAIVDHLRGNTFNSLGLLLALKAGEPYRLARALVLEAGYQSSPGRPTMRQATVLLDQAEALARRVSNPHAFAFMLAARGQAAFLWGRFREAAETCHRAENMLSEQCSGVANELMSARVWSCRALQYLGDFQSLAERLPRFIHESETHNDLYGATTLRVAALPFLFLARDEPLAALEAVENGLQSWTTRGFHVQHYFALVSRVSVDLYAERPEAAYRRIQEQWRPLKGAFLLRVQVVRVVMYDLRARAALALALGASGRERERLLGEAARDATRLDKERMPWSSALAALIRAGIAWVRHPGEEHAALYESAAEKLDRVDMGLHAACARYRQGGILGGEKGAALVKEAQGFMGRQSIRRQERMVGLLAPMETSCCNSL